MSLSFRSGIFDELKKRDALLVLTLGLKSYRSIRIVPPNSYNYYTYSKNNNNNVYGFSALSLRLLTTDAIFHARNACTL